MRLERIITTVDSHTAGEPTRVITGGLPHIPGNTMAEKMEYFRANLDFIRTTIIHEPRGHRDMIGAVLLPPTRKEADFGVFYLNPGGFLNMCGHGTIGVATTLVEIGWITAQEPITKVVLDTPAGLVTVKLEVENGTINNGSLINVPSFLYAENVKISIPGIGRINVDVAFGGNFFILVNVKDLGLDILPQNVGNFIKHAGIIADEVNKTIKVAHPEEKHITNVRAVHFYGPPSHPQANSKTLIVGSRGNIDRSPCGTGTSARMGALYAQGKLRLGEIFCTESVIGTIFRGKVLEEKKTGEYLAIVPEITASAYLTGFHQFVIEPSDPLKYGFTL
jgi:proline racemase/trans-L-3-hydroxyproline dehydratase